MDSQYSFQLYRRLKAFLKIKYREYQRLLRSMKSDTSNNFLGFLVKLNCMSKLSGCKTFKKQQMRAQLRSQIKCTMLWNLSRQT